MSNKRTIAKVLSGSRLLGIHRDDSDYDYIEIFLPSKHDILMGKTLQSTQKICKKIDTKYLSIQKYLNFINKKTIPEFVLILFANEDQIIQTSPEWEEIVKNRDKLINYEDFIQNMRKSAYKFKDPIDYEKFFTLNPSCKIQSRIVREIAELYNLEYVEKNNQEFIKINNKLINSNHRVYKLQKYITRMQKSEFRFDIYKQISKDICDGKSIKLPIIKLIKDTSSWPNYQSNKNLDTKLAEKLIKKYHENQILSTNDVNVRGQNLL